MISAEDDGQGSVLTRLGHRPGQDRAVAPDAFQPAPAAQVVFASGHGDRTPTEAPR